MQWFRFYSETLRDPKVLKLSDKDFRFWTTCLCVACDNDGYIPPIEGLKVVLNKRLDHVSKLVERLCKAGLIDTLEEGYIPHGWEKRQYKSDTSTDRVHKHRAKRNVSVTVSETAPDTDTDTDPDTPIPPLEQKIRPPKLSPRFAEFWTAYPTKVGKKKCSEIWKRRNLDTIADLIIADVTRRRIDDVKWTEGFIQNPQTYLNGDRWEDEIQTKRVNGHKENGANEPIKDWASRMAAETRAKMEKNDGNTYEHGETYEN